MRPGLLRRSSLDAFTLSDKNPKLFLLEHALVTKLHPSRREHPSLKLDSVGCCRGGHHWLRCVLLLRGQHCVAANCGLALLNLQTRNRSARQLTTAFLISAAFICSFSAFSAKAATSASEAKRKATNCDSVRSPIRDFSGSFKSAARRNRSSSRITRS